jgi:arsenite methyltransferase
MAGPRLFFADMTEGGVAKLPDYGIDAPTIVRNQALAGLLAWLLGAGLFAWFMVRPVPDHDRAWSWLAQGGLTGAFLLAAAGFMVWSSRRGKLRVRDRVLGLIAWRGDERVLDIGCGRGLALIGAASRVPRGQAVGVDLWSAVDLSGNNAEATWRNARAAGVADRIAIETGDARALPFPDAAFDAVVSMTAIHNIKDAAGRRQAIREAVRVLKPGGHLALFDIFHAGPYRAWLQEEGMLDIGRSGLILLWMVPGRILSARKGPTSETNSL